MTDCAYPHCTLQEEHDGPHEVPEPTPPPVKYTRARQLGIEWPGI